MKNPFYKIARFINKVSVWSSADPDRIARFYVRKIGFKEVFRLTKKKGGSKK